ncbi:riboflavin synthase [Helicobacter cappadocius]|uniref:Riboflavin synthase n=1 Tax=Helicobacter cappadocius TaxID=3063998 RepID=A0AA90PL44_9HELI|nr:MULTISPECIES: riboflavin synthase [unclassified Helicobacter]MDO7253185.1 riboflavin synthase [Helicobacter sp. faydin-H75]MDP2539109.1 riboflavin synthase [Helicobacter sp. faydin-H76]
MFSGLVREIAKVKKFQNNILYIQTPYKPKLGDSIAVNGACLTVVTITSDGFGVELSKHTQKCVAMENYHDLVHIEPALLANSRLDGHFVQGHIDSIGTIVNIIPNANQTDFIIKAPKDTLNLIIPQGSITVDGISLTISEVFEDSFKLTIIPYTIKHTLIKNYKVNRRVNIETDILVRSIAHLLKKRDKNLKSNSWKEIDSILLGY